MDYTSFSPGFSYGETIPTPIATTITAMENLTLSSLSSSSTSSSSSSSMIIQCQQSGCTKRPLKGINFCRKHSQYKSNGGPGRNRYEKFKKKTQERAVQLRLSRSLNGNIEVPCPIGRVDIVTHTYIIEVKRFHKWKEAIGQILSYALYFPDKRKGIYLFDVPPGQNMMEVQNCCFQNGIELYWEH